ncbi:hypothetical protein [Brevibacillus migulae]|uniref:hypothetical protein n=1 Tax=Brevibacillus migulae TaxID=1644114 RepID=UPI00106ECEB9|nr:hypothetical protein [Brevibacillus migulae]
MNRLKNGAAVLLALIMLVSLLPAKAEEAYDLTVDLPLGGIFTFNQWTRLNVTVHNNSTEALQGTVIFTQTQEAGGKQPMYRKAVTIHAGESQAVPIDVPAEYLLNGPAEVRLMKGDLLVAREKLSSFNPKGERTVGVIGDNNNAFHFLAIGSDQRDHQWVPFSVQHMEPEMLPSESWLLKNLDVLAFADTGHVQISSEQVLAIKEWLNRGGVLILSGDSRAGSLFAQFQDIFPVAAGKSGLRTDMTELRQLTGGEIPPLEAIPVYNQNYPYFTTKQVGAGVLIFVNFDVTAEPLASWQHNRQLWQKVFTQSNALDSIEKKNELNPVDRSLLSLSKYIPEVQMPKVTWIIGIFMIYLLFISPILYWLLKRKDRHIWAWGIIPVSAVVLSLSVYLIGRTLIVQTNASYHVSKLLLLDKKMAEVQTASSILSVSGGDYDLRLDKEMLTVPVNSSGGNWGEEGAMVVTDENGATTLAFRNVPYLSEKQIISSGIRTDIGAFESDLSVMNGKITGTIVNRTVFALENLYLDLGMQRISLGAMKPGETKQVEAAVEEFYIAEQMEGLLPSDKAQTREEHIEQLKKSTSFVGSNEVRLVGVSAQPLHTVDVLLEGKRHYWNVLMQRIRLQANQTGTFIYPYGTNNVFLIDQKGNVESNTPNMFDIIRGEATFALSLNQANLRVTRVEIPLDQSPYRPFKKEIYHSKSGTWQPLGREERVQLTEKLTEYVNEEGRILIRFSNPTDQRLSLPQPYFQVEGVEQSS